MGKNSVPGIFKGVNQDSFGLKDPENYVFKSEKGLSEKIVEQISSWKNEPKWMLDFRKKALKHFFVHPYPKWGPNLSELDLSDLYYYARPIQEQKENWDEVPDNIKNTFEPTNINPIGMA